MANTAGQFDIKCVIRQLHQDRNIRPITFNLSSQLMGAPTTKRSKNQ